MKIIIATTSNPFVGGGASLMAQWLEKALVAAGHQVELLEFPFSSDYRDLLHQALALRLVDVSQHGDRLIAIRPLSYLLKHPHKIVWFIHHHRGAYDLWGTRYRDIPTTPFGVGLRQFLFSADRVGLAEAQRLFCNSKTTARRLKEYNNLDAEVLYPPVWRPDRFRCGPPGDYVVCIARLTHHKRQWLAVESLQYTETPVRLVIAGEAAPGEEAYAAELRDLVARLKLQDRVTLWDRWISEDTKISLLENCLAAMYLPFDEDSYGFSALEAFHAAKPVVTTTDAGGVLELVEDHESGIVVSPEPSQIAHALDQLYADRAKAKGMGEAARNRISELRISWDRVLEALLS